MGRIFWPVALLAAAAGALSAGFAALRQIDRHREDFEELAELEKKKVRLQAQLKDKEAVAFVGIKGRALVVYLREAVGPGEIPAEFEGVAVSSVVLD